MAPKAKKPAKSLTEEQKAIHLLDRTAFGPRPGDVERVRRMGLDKYLDEQLHPERITDATAEEKLKGIESVKMTNEQLAASYPPPQVLREALKARGIELPNQQNQNQPPPMPPPMPPPDNAMNTDEMRTRQRAQQVMRELGYRPQQQIVQELQQAKILRAVYSERQLQEVMTDFWFNHFNVFAAKGADRVLVTSYERDVIRPNVFGKFEDLLRATAKSPAMLFYLDNWLSASPDAKMPPRRFGQGFAQPRQGQPGQPGQMPNQPPGLPPQGRRRGLNENYAREVMELHTLGVDGGYTQKDVQEIARCFTGWTIREPRRGAEFIFNRFLHDDGEKVVLGTKIPADGGMRDGEMVIKLLAHHPSTAKFISTKLARKFVSDNPPQTLVDRLAQVFQKTDGDLREVLRALFTSPEFLSPESFRAKIKTPFEMTVSAVRALGAETNGGPQFHRWMAQMGEPLFMAQPPTGYDDTAQTWVNTGALLERMNFGLALVSSRIPGTSVDLAKLAPPGESKTPSSVAEHYIKLLLRGQVSPQTRATLDKSLSSPEIARSDTAGTKIDQAKIVGLILGSPEFQRQ
jgi:uncharacterized protein (DUF1800 family)